MDDNDDEDLVSSIEDGIEKGKDYSTSEFLLLRPESTVVKSHVLFLAR